MSSYSRKHQKMASGFVFVSNAKNNQTKRIKRNQKTKLPTTLPCTGPILAGTRWRTIESYMIDTTNAAGMSDSFVKTAYQAAIDVWLANITPQPLKTLTTGTVDGIDLDNPDGKNEVVFGNIDEPGVIGLTIIWTIGDSIIEADQIYNDVDFNWGDATSNPSLMDFQSIATHEIGHSLGLTDIYSGGCSAVTMFGTASEGQTNKRTLETEDINGLKDLYGEYTGNSSPPPSSSTRPNFNFLLLIILIFIEINVIGF
jgi:hypothetical protein